MGEKGGSRGAESLPFKSHYPHVCISSERQGLHGRGSRSVRSRNPPNAFYSQLILVGLAENFQNPQTAVTGHGRTLRVIFCERTEAQKDDREKPLTSKVGQNGAVERGAGYKRRPVRS